MKMKRIITNVFIAATLASMTGSAAIAGDMSVVVSTSLLASAAQEVLPRSESIKIVTLLSPSSCPGHFDLSPRVVPLLASASIAIRHDYQGIIEEKLVSLGVGSTSFLTVSAPQSPLIPSNYYLITQQIGAMLGEIAPENRNTIAEAIESLKLRTDNLARKVLSDEEQWKGCPVIAATNVAELCRWLGFNVVGTIKRPEDMTPRDYQKLVTLNADMIVANLQEGTHGAESLGESMKIPVAVLSNFPGLEGYGNDYYDLMKTNLMRLDEAWQKR